MQNIKVNISLVTKLSDRELEEVTSVSNLAYLDANSPAVSLLTGGKLELLPDLFRAMTRSCLIDGDCYVATEVTSRKIIGTALWFPPGKCMIATEDVRQSSGFYDFFSQLEPATKDWWINDYDAEVQKFLMERYGPETSTESWWLNNIAVLPEYQGNGIGTSLYKQVLNKATVDEAIGCCTDSEKNVKFYESMHMRNIGQIAMRHPGDGSDVYVWGFKRYGVRPQA